MSAKPVVYETQVSSAFAANERHRGNLSRLLEDAEHRRDHAKAILSEVGVELLSVDSQPEDLGLDEKKFTILGKHRPVQELMDLAKKAAPELEIVEKTPLSNALEFEYPMPFVLKRPDRDSGGVNKYLINRPDQIEKLKEYCSNYDFLADQWFTEPYIETPGGVNSSYRVVVTATGVVIASALLYQPREAGKKAEATFVDRPWPTGNGRIAGSDRRNPDGWTDFADRESKWFLDADAVTSNVSGGGKIIPLKVGGEIGVEPDLSLRERRILRRHGINGLETPPELLDAAAALGREIGPKMALTLGIDFIQDQNGTRPLLEINAQPGVESILTWWGLDPSKVSGDLAKTKLASDDLTRVVGDMIRKL